MKCIRCGTDNNLKDRTANQGRCKNCRHQFVFEPTSMGNVKITDPMFAKSISVISANNTLFFTPKQLLYFLDSRLKSKSFTVFGFILFYIFFHGFAIAFLNSFLQSNLVYGIYLINFIFVILLFNYSKSSKINNRSRRGVARTLQVIGTIILAGGIVTSIVILDSFIAFVIGVILGMLSIYLGTRQLRQTGLTQELLIEETQLQTWLNRWQNINGSIVQMLPPAQQSIAPARVNPDVTAYSFDRLVVCDSDTLAQLLIANNFHFENNCAILSITGYPQSIFDITMQMLRRNLDLKVYAFHDSSPQGISLIHQLRTNPTWFLNSDVAIFDVGLLPRQIITIKNSLFVQSCQKSATAAKQLPTEIRQSLSAEEMEWLDSGKFVELESFGPQKLMQILHRGIVGSLTIESDDSNIIVVGDTGSNMYVVESFG